MMGGMFKLSRHERMDLSVDNPAVALYLRLEALHGRGLSPALARMLWQAGDLSLVAQVEAATDDQIAALNAAA